MISPLILFAEVFCFALILITHRYNANYRDTRCFAPGGSFYPHAIKQLVGGLYGLQTVLFFLLLLTTNSDQQLACIWQALVVGFSGIGTLFFDRVVQKTFDPLLHYRPASTFPENELGGKKSFPSEGRGRGLRTEDWGTSEYISENFILKQALVSIPRDPAGFSKLEVENTSLFASAIAIADNEATMDASGRVALAQTLD